MKKRSDGYPTAECLREIRKWRIGGPKFHMSLKNLKRLLNILEDNHRWGSFFGFDYALHCDDFDRIVVKLYYSTGGWSGHEEQIAELERTFFWIFCWEQSRRGGHYIFEINPKQFGRARRKRVKLQAKHNKRK